MSLGSLFHLVRNANEKSLRNLAYFLEAVVVKRASARQGVEHIHTHFSTNPAAVAMLSRRLGGPSYSFTVHGPDELIDTAGNSLELKVRYADCVVAITDYCRDFILRHTDAGYSDKVHVVRCGVHLEDYQEATEHGHNRRLVCVGRLCPQKAQALLVEAVARLAPKYPDLKVIFVGDGEDRASLEAKIAELGVEKFVDLAGWATNRDVRRHITESRALVMSSLAEGLPIVIMESFAVQKPVVATRIAGIPELLDDTCGWIAEPGSVEDLTRCLEAVLTASPAELETKGRNGRAKVQAMHDQDRNAAELRKLLTK